MWSRTSLHDAIAKGDKNKAEVLLKTGADINAHDPQGYTPLNLAIWNGNERMVKFLLENKAQVEDNDRCMPALHAAIINGHETIVELLLSRGADIERRCAGRTPLAAAANGGNDSLVKLLLDRGALVDARDSCGATPLLDAVVRGHEKIVMLLLQKSANVDAKNSSGRSSIKCASNNWRDPAIKSILEQWLSYGLSTRFVAAYTGDKST